MVMDDKEATSPHIPNTRSILQHVLCATCVRESVSTGERPTEYSSLEVGLTKHGLQVWCTRHNVNVVHIDFQGIKPRANPNASVPVGVATAVAEC